jgi:NADH-quinone oxidoreductase subunit J
VVAAGLAAVVCAAAVEAFHGERIELGDDAGRGSSASTGAALFRAWVLPFEVLSVLLLAALVGAIVLSRRDIGVDDDRPVREAG